MPTQFETTIGLRGPLNRRTANLAILFATLFIQWQGFNAIAIEPTATSVHQNEVKLCLPKGEIAISGISRSATGVSCLTLIAPAPNSPDSGKAIMSVTRNWVLYKGARLPRAHRNSGEAVLVIDTSTGESQSLRYHHPAPNTVAVSACGTYVAFASYSGWNPQGMKPALSESDHEDSATTDENDQGDNEIVGNEVLREMAVGSVFVSVWALTPLRLEWEMRFATDVEDAKKAQFERPWDRMSRVDVPWWSHELQRDFRIPRIAFAPRGKWLALFDKKCGLRVLDVERGIQRRIDSLSSSRNVADFFFSEDGLQLRLICRDGMIRTIDIETGKADDRLEFALPADFIGPQISGRNLRFCSNAQNGLFAAKVGRNKSIMLATCRQKSGHAVPEFAMGESLDGLLNAVPSRVVVSKDLRTVGLAFGASGTFDDHGGCREFVLVDRETGSILERLVCDYPEDQVDIPGVLTNRCKPPFDASLSFDGSKIVYARLQSGRKVDQ